MRTMRAIRFLTLFAVAAAALCQREDEPYFSLMSQHTYPSNGKPAVSLSAWNVDGLDFRVYRVNDPLQFFRQIEDPHQFGGRAPEPAREMTPIERFHEWKRELRAHIRRSLRLQFTESPSAHFESAAAKASTPGSAKGTHYAEAPLLNPQQLVLSFHEPVRSQSRWDRQTVAVPVTNKGVYLVEAVNKQLRAYTILIVSDITLVTKTGKGKLVNLLVDRRSGEPIPHATVYLEGRDKSLGSAETDSNGFAVSSFDGNKPDDVRIVARYRDDYAVTALEGYAFSVNREDWTGYVYTDRPVYRPGHTVHFKAILRSNSPAGYQVPAGKQVNVQIQDPDEKPVYQKTLTVTPMGTVHDDLTLAAGASLGDYSIQIKTGDSSANGSFEVQDYKKPEYEVRVTPAKTRILQGESMQATIDARYYFGEPVNGAKVEYAVYRDRYWFPLWYDPDDEIDDAAIRAQRRRFRRPDLERRRHARRRWQADGQHSVAGFRAQRRLYLPRRSARHRSGQPRNHRQRLDRRHLWQLRDQCLARPLLLSRRRGKMTFTVQARDYDNKAVNAHVHLELLRWNYRKPDIANPWAARPTSTRQRMVPPQLRSMRPQRGGSYRVHATARTPEGRVVEDYGYFFVSGGGMSDFGARR